MAATCTWRACRPPGTHAHRAPPRWAAPRGCVPSTHPDPHSASPPALTIGAVSLWGQLRGMALSPGHTTGPDWARPSASTLRRQSAKCPGCSLTCGPQGTMDTWAYPGTCARGRLPVEAPSPTAQCLIFFSVWSSLPLLMYKLFLTKAFRNGYRMYVYHLLLSLSNYSLCARMSYLNFIPITFS